MSSPGQNWRPHRLRLLLGWIALQGRPLIEATRLGVTEEKAGRLVKTVLFKACFLYCLRLGIESIVIAARSPMDRQYYRLSYKDVYPDMGYIPLRHAGNIPHRIMSFDVFGGFFERVRRL